LDLGDGLIAFLFEFSLSVKVGDGKAWARLPLLVLGGRSCVCAHGVFVDPAFAKRRTS